MKEQIIQLPDNFEVKEIKDNKIILVEKEKKLPKTWEEYCETHSKGRGESWFDGVSQIYTIDKIANKYRDYIKDKNLLPNPQYAEAMLALCQLIQLRDCYNDGWVPDWTKVYNKYVIYIMKDQIHKDVNVETCRILTFKTKELSDKFLNNFKDLIEIAKPLL